MINGQVLLSHLRCLIDFMTVMETIVSRVQNLPQREQVDVARYVQRLRIDVQQARADILRPTHGVLDDADGLFFV
jgi:hypothetical protein